MVDQTKSAWVVRVVLVHIKLGESDYEDTRYRPESAQQPVLLV